MTVKSGACFADAVRAAYPIVSTGPYKSAWGLQQSQDLDTQNPPTMKAVKNHDLFLMSCQMCQRDVARKSKAKIIAAATDGSYWYSLNS